MSNVPPVENLSDYMRMAENATVIYLPLADEVASYLAFWEDEWYLLINSKYQPQPENQNTQE